MAVSKRYSPEIQGLRAVAVGLVLIFHVWPSVLTGGYVGVDVFFVISGYLITGKLARTAMTKGRISLIDFYAARARRLLPIGSLVLALTFAGTFVFLPESRWNETTTQIAASALFAQNWVLAWLSVDYLGAENAASPVQHYWSLSIEEQFYFVWPLVMIAAIYLSRRFGLSLRRTFVVALSLIFVGSLATSVFLTAREPAQAYFVTHTRMWELALGGLLALTIHRINIGSRILRAGMALAGLAAIVWSGFAYSPATPFPGTAALAPTVGTALLIVAGDVRLGFFRGLNARWLTWVGDRSYSIYLWHWPLVVFYTAHDADIGYLDGAAILALTLLLSHLSYLHVEERYRHPSAPVEWRPIVYGVASIALFVVASSAAHYAVSVQAAPRIEAGEELYPGAMALVGAPVPDVDHILPAPSVAKADLQTLSREGCQLAPRETKPIECIFGDRNGAPTVFFIGDSHAGNWRPAMEAIAEREGWRLLIYMKSGCPFLFHSVLTSGREYWQCRIWAEKMSEIITSDAPDYIIIGQSSAAKLHQIEPPAHFGRLVEETRKARMALEQSGATVYAIADTPRWRDDPVECVSTRDDCSIRLSDSLPRDPLIEVYGRDGRLIDMNKWVCPDGICPAVIGNVLVWRDKHHLTRTYALSMTTALAEILSSKIESRALSGAMLEPRK